MNSPYTERYLRILVHATMRMQRDEWRCETCLAYLAATRSTRLRHALAAAENALDAIQCRPAALEVERFHNLDTLEPQATIVVRFKDATSARLLFGLADSSICYVRMSTGGTKERTRADRTRRRLKRARARRQLLQELQSQARQLVGGSV